MLERPKQRGASVIRSPIDALSERSLVLSSLHAPDKFGVSSNAAP